MIIEECLSCTTQQFIEVYLDLNHVSIAHPGLNTWVDVRNAKVEVQESAVRQVAQFNPWEKKHGKYKLWYEAWMDHFRAAPKFGAIWHVDFDSGEMVEEYPGMHILSTVRTIERGCLNEVRFRQLPNVPSDVFDAGVQAYLETADEDKIIVENIALDQEMVRHLGGTFHAILPNTVKNYRRFLNERSRG